MPGATGFLDTDYGAKARYGLESLKNHAISCFCISRRPMKPVIWAAPDLKTEAIEQIDELIIGPMLPELAAMGEFAILLQPDHATPSKLKTHSSEAVPFALLTSKTYARTDAAARRYTEAAGRSTGIEVSDGYRLIESLLGKGGVLGQA